MSTANRSQPPVRPATKPNKPQAATSAGVLDDPLIDVRTVCKMVGFNSPTPIYDRLREGDFPQPIRLSARCTRWRASSVRSWIESKEGKPE